MVLSMDRWVGKVAVVTGASSGIGASIAEHLVEEGVKVAALARRKEKLDNLAKKLDGKKGKLYPIKADLTNEQDLLNAFTWIKNNLGPIHILINNAGTGVVGLLTDENTTQDWINIFQLNVISLCIATREAIKDMKENNIDGHIIHISSILGDQVYYKPGGSNVYSSTKFAVRALAETLRLELGSQKSKIKITNVSPGLIQTELIEDKVNVEKLKAESKILEPEQVADGVIYALSTPPHVQIQQLTIRPILDE